MKGLKITDVQVDGRRTTVSVKVDVPGSPDPVRGTGWSKCREEDVFTGVIGVEIALGRAIIDVGAQIARAAEARVVTEDEMQRAADVMFMKALEEPSSHVLVAGKG